MLAIPLFIQKGTDSIVACVRLFLDCRVLKISLGWLLFHGSVSRDCFKWSRWIGEGKEERARERYGVRRRERNGERQVPFDCCGNGISIPSPSVPSHRLFGWWQSTEVFYVLPSFLAAHFLATIHSPLSSDAYRLRELKVGGHLWQPAITTLGLWWRTSG